LSAGGRIDMRLIFFVEGQTEQAYVARVLAPHLANFGVFANRPILPITGRHRDRIFKGGGRSFVRIRRQFDNLLKQHDQPDVRFTTMFDLSGLHADFPGRKESETQGNDPKSRVMFLEQAFANEFADRRVIPHIQLHEFETILLAGPEDLALFFDNPRPAIDALTAAIATFASIELVNDGLDTRPSKRIEKCFSSFPRLKTTVGVEWDACIGLERTRQACPHFDEWIGRLERLGSPEAAAQPPEWND
jgi:Domain of unknown function (DUF4276)